MSQRIAPVVVALVAIASLAAETIETRLPNGDVILQFNHPDRQDKPTDKPVPSRTRMWIPGDVKVLRGALFDLGYSYSADRRDVQAVARAEGLAVISCLLRYKGGTELLQTALADFATRSGHPELTRMPILPMGFSRNGSRAWTFTEENPTRTIAVALGGNPAICLRRTPNKDGPDHLALARTTPALTVVGSKDPFVDYDKGEARYWHIAHYPVIRAIPDVTWGMMIGWGYGHGWEGSWALFTPYIQAVWRLRAPAQPTADGAVTLKPIAFADGWFAEYGWTKDWPEIAPVATFTGDRTKSIWLPSEDVAAVWRAYNVMVPKVTLAVAAGAMTTLTATPPDGTTTVQFYDRHLALGEAVAAPWQVKTDRLASGAHSVYAVAVTASGRTPSRPLTVVKGQPIDWTSGDADQKAAEHPASVARLDPDLRAAARALCGLDAGVTVDAARKAALKAVVQALVKDPFVEQRNAGEALLKLIAW